MEFEIDPRARTYYDRTTLESAIQSTKERIEEWSYEEDPHGYCHVRPELIKLVEAAERSTAPA
jgi:hypothetical protein